MKRKSNTAYNRYQRKYRRSHPEKVMQWRINDAKKLLEKARLESTESIEKSGVSG